MYWSYILIILFYLTILSSQVLSNTYYSSDRFNLNSLLSNKYFFRICWPFDKFVTTRLLLGWGHWRRGETPGARFPKRRQAQVGCETEIGERAVRRVPQMLSPITDKSTNYLRNATTLTKNAVNLSAPGPTTRDRPLLATAPQLKHLRQPATTTWQAIVERWADLWAGQIDPEVYEDLQSINTNLTSCCLEMVRFLDRGDVLLEVYEDLYQPTKSALTW